MKKTALFYTAISTVLLTGCGSNSRVKEQVQKQFPKPGTTVAEAQVPVTDDALNHFTFSVKVIADSDVTDGVYDVDAEYGPNFDEGKFTMPKGIEDVKPIIRKGSAPYTFIVGFRIAGDTTFNDYFQVSSTKHSTKMEYIKAYTF
jgi:hypothetical protein